MVSREEKSGHSCKDGLPLWSGDGAEKKAVKGGAKCFGSVCCAAE